MDKNSKKKETIFEKAAKSTLFWNKINAILSIIGILIAILAFVI